jgi:hypothetical protein
MATGSKSIRSWRNVRLQSTLKSSSFLTILRMSCLAHTSGHSLHQLPAPNPLTNLNSRSPWFARVAVDCDDLEFKGVCAVAEDFNGPFTGVDLEDFLAAAVADVAGFAGYHMVIAMTRMVGHLRLQSSFNQSFRFLRCHPGQLNLQTSCSSPAARLRVR